ncbi:hypothetical protein [Marinococcus luteus]|uniref:hypothetical protein n=1 Tax=Marinococcus luteus TaxID=1122204 RepID=UPI002ACDE795|nr:hypothetical protein [Marinococcus luteus]
MSLLNEAILFVEDDQDIHSLVSTPLKKEDYQVISAFDGDEALALFPWLLFLFPLASPAS